MELESSDGPGEYAANTTLVALNQTNEIALNCFFSAVFASREFELSHLSSRESSPSVWLGDTKGANHLPRDADGEDADNDRLNVGSDGLDSRSN